MKGCGDEDDEVERTGRRGDEIKGCKMRMRMKTGKMRANHSPYTLVVFGSLQCG